ncbi:MAG: hypothetical protein Q6L58_10585 [Thermostichales cyanobacterium BF3_bins_165]
MKRLKMKAKTATKLIDSLEKAKNKELKLIQLLITSRRIPHLRRAFDNAKITFTVSENTIYIGFYNGETNEYRELGRGQVKKYLHLKRWRRVYYAKQRYTVKSFDSIILFKIDNKEQVWYEFLAANLKYLIYAAG